MQQLTLGTATSHSFSSPLSPALLWRHFMAFGRTSPFHASRTIHLSVLVGLLCLFVPVEAKLCECRISVAPWSSRGTAPAGVWLTFKLWSNFGERLVKLGQPFLFL